MADDQARIFPLMDLPGEIRNNIYRQILCCFEPSDCLDRGSEHDIVQATHSVDTAILRTCRQVHREAYDCMVKTNQFIKISSVDVPIFADLLLSYEIPVVTMDRAAVDQFHGCVMKVDLSVVPGEWVDEPYAGDGEWDDDFDSDIHVPPAGNGPRFNLMILWRDWNKFCQSLGKANGSLKGFDRNVRIDITLNGYPQELPNWKAPISAYFTLERQKSLLGKFSTELRGFPHVSLSGLIDDELAASTAQAVAGRLWTSPADVLTTIKASRDAADIMYAAVGSKSLPAYNKALQLMDEIHGSSDFDRLADDGGPAFATAFVENFYNASLDFGKTIIEHMQSEAPAAALPSLGELLNKRLAMAEELAEDSAEDHGSSFNPTPALVGRYSYIRAVGCRLWGEALPEAQWESRVGLLEYAVGSIGFALSVSPGDPQIVAELDRIEAWKSEFSEPVLALGGFNG